MSVALAIELAIAAAKAILDRLPAKSRRSAAEKAARVMLTLYTVRGDAQAMLDARKRK